MFEITKTFVHETGLQITPFFMQGTGFVFLPKELEGQLGYEELSKIMTHSESFNEGVEYLILRDDNLQKFKELLMRGNTITSHLKEGFMRSNSLLLLTESGLYTAMILSRKPQAKIFRRWITCEVLPSIRQKGFYLHSAQGDIELSTVSQESAFFEQKNEIISAIVDKVVDKMDKSLGKLQSQIKFFVQDTCQRLDQVEDVLSECKKQHDIFGGWKMIKMLVEDMTQLYDLSVQERRNYFTSLCQQYDISLPEKAFGESEKAQYDVQEIAHKLGLYTSKGTLHTSFVKALLSHLHLPKIASSTKKACYSPQTIVSIHNWLQERKFPSTISLPFGKGTKMRHFELEYHRLK
ncbi:MAG: hypothetical protein HUU50_05120 [Candidatus Brocadiae bacterium]|nr:hypothetical protein [Candidatus Brocadiia bacterium]